MHKLQVIMAHKARPMCENQCTRHIQTLVIVSKMEKLIPQLASKQQSRANWSRRDSSTICTDSHNQKRSACGGHHKKHNRDKFTWSWTEF